ncbi:MAG: extracellular solute-binding protein [Kiloniellaceae bacterium]
MTKISKSRTSSELTQRAARAFTRRTLMKGAAAAGAVAAVGPFVIGAEARAAARELKVMIWSDYIPDEFKDKFESKTGLTLKVTGYGSNEELINKIKATKGRGFDLIGPTSVRMLQWKDLALLQPWDMSRVPTDRILKPMLQTSIDHGSWDGKNYHLPYLWGTEALAWRTDKWSRDYRDLTYGDMYTEDMKGKIMGRPHSMMLTMGLYLDRTGRLPTNRMLDAYKDEENMRRIWTEITKFAVEHKPWVKQFWNDADAQINGFMQNDVVLGQCWDGPPLRLKAEGKPVTYMAPMEGALTWLDGLSMPIGAKNIDGVYAFLDVLYTPENGGLLANKTGYNSVAVDADKHLSAQSQKNFREAYPQDALEKLWWWPPEPTWYAGIRAEYRDKFVAA